MNKKELINKFVNKWNTIFEPFIPDGNIRKRLIINFHDDCMHMIEQLLTLTQEELKE